MFHITDLPFNLLYQIGNQSTGKYKLTLSAVPTRSTTSNVAAVFPTWTRSTVPYHLAADVGTVRSHWTRVLGAAVGAGWAVVADRAREVLKKGRVVRAVVSRRTLEALRLLRDVVVRSCFTRVWTGGAGRTVVCCRARTSNQWLIT